MLERLFKLSERNTDIKTEVVAGVTTFMTMAYILILQPLFMSKAGMDFGAVTVVTILLTAAFTLFMAFYTNLPFALAPAMGSNAFLAFTLVLGGIVNWQTAIGMVFISGIAFLLLTVLGLREVIVKMIPKSLKLAIGALVGFFIVLLGFKSAGFITFTTSGFSIGDLSTPNATLALIGIAIVVILMANRVKGALLITIIITTVIGIPMGITHMPEKFITLPPSIAPIAFKLDIAGALKWSLFPFIFTFFVGDFFSTLGTLLGVSAKAKLLDNQGNLPNINKPFLVDATATVVGAILGSSVVTTYVESAAGVEEGGRTGLTGVVTAGCFLLTLFLTPVAAMIPGVATAPALIIIGLFMLSGLKDIDFSDFSEAFPPFAAILFTTYTASISNGISVGILSYAFIKLVTLKFREVHWGLYLLCVPLIYYFVIL